MYKIVYVSNQQEERDRLAEETKSAKKERSKESVAKKDVSKIPAPRKGTHTKTFCQSINLK